MEYIYERGKHKGKYLVNSDREPKKDPDNPGKELEASKEPDFAQVIHNIVEPVKGQSIWIGCNDGELKIKIDPPPDKAKKSLIDAAVDSHKNDEKNKIDLDL